MGYDQQGLTALGRGQVLEQRIGEFFQAHGYAVELNAVLEGRSGGRHEVDVLAVKSDALTTFTVAVECKAWAQPIEKDVVSKLHYVLGDLGLNKGIIASLGGCRSGAERTAESLGIELWGQDELRRHLGDGGFEATAAGVADRPPTRVAPGYPFITSPERAERLLRSTGKGALGFRTVETLVAVEGVWLPTFHLTLTVAQAHTKRFRTELRSTTVVNVYEALGGTFLGSMAEPPIEVDLDASVVTPLRSDAQVHGLVRKALDARHKVSSERAVARHDEELQELGIPTPCQSLTVDRCELVYRPYFIGLLRRGTEDRVAAVSAQRGVVSEQVGDVLTANLSHLRSCLATRSS